MLLDCRVHYLTDYGQRLEVVTDDGATELHWAGDGWWAGQVEVDAGGSYGYRLVDDHGLELDEDGPRRNPPPEARDGATVVDRWQVPDPARRARSSALLSRAVAARYGDRPAPRGPLCLRVLEPSVPAGLRVAVVGSDPALGAWDPAAAVPCGSQGFPWWDAGVELTHPEVAVAYKYVLVDEVGELVAWEDGDDRLLPADLGPGALVTDEGLHGRPPWRAAGVALPVFALRTDRSLGVGQFTDIPEFAGWAAQAGLTVLQVLPVNDTIKHHDWSDSYPYDPVSVHALHPLYVDVAALPGAEAVRDDLAALRAEVEPADEIDYPRVMAAKWALLRRLYQDGPADEGFETFVDEEWWWLGAYAWWCTLRDRYGTPDHTGWGRDASFDPDRHGRTAGLADADVRFHAWVQYHLRRQLDAAVTEARNVGVALKGDLPIGVSPTSVETWVHPELFRLGTQTGAPPDDFARHGQNWGFPTYDWERMAEDGYRWWQHRFQALSRAYDAYRIDHVLGFFRIWEIPADAVDGLLGRFRPCLPLTDDELLHRLGVVELDRFLRPAVDDVVLTRLFGDLAQRVRERCFEGPDEDLRLVDRLGTQGLIVEAFAAGLFDELEQHTRTQVERGLLDIAGDVLLLETDGGYHPRILWGETESYRRLPEPLKRAFDAVAIDFLYHRHEELWEQRGRATLRAVIDASDLLPCGEDLGMVPTIVPQVMEDLGVLSLEIERMPKDMSVWRSDPAEAPYLSVVSTSTHDMPPLRHWWQTERDEATRTWHEVLGGNGDPPLDAPPDTCRQLVASQLASPAMLCVLPLADLLAIDGDLRRDDPAAERINVPADRHHRWRYRLHLDVDDLVAARDFTEQVRALVADLGRV